MKYNTYFISNEYNMKTIVFIILLTIRSFVNSNSTTHEVQQVSPLSHSSQSYANTISTHPIKLPEKTKHKSIPLPAFAQNIIQEENYIYVDKTKFVMRLFELRFVLFMRPRRFGKSFFISTVASILRAEKLLFKDCYIGDENNGYNWKKHIVITITFSRTNAIEEFETDLKAIASEYGLDEHFTDKTSPNYHLFYDLLIMLSKKGKPIAILFDECDLPFRSSDNVVHYYFQNIYQQLSKLLSYGKINFIFVTGVNKVNLNDKILDISMHEDFASLCGFTIEEIEIYYDEYIEEKAKMHEVSKEFIYGQIVEWYNGYRFTPSNTTVLNPVSLSHYLFKKYCNLPLNFSVKTQSHPKHIYEALILTKMKKNEIVLNLKHIYSEDELFQSLDYVSTSPEDFVDNNTDMAKLQTISIESYFYQNGYLTIKSFYIDRNGFSLMVPNKETRNVLDDAIKLAMEAIPDYINLHNRAVDTYKRFNISEAVEVFSMFASSYAQIILYDAIEGEEKIYQKILHLLLTITIPEKEQTNKGWIVQKEYKVFKKNKRIGFVDFYIETSTHRIIIECKHAVQNINREFKQVENYIFPRPIHEYNPPLKSVRLLYNFYKYDIRQWMGSIYDMEDNVIQSISPKNMASIPSVNFICEFCGNQYTYKRNFERHIRNKHKRMQRIRFNLI